MPLVGLGTWKAPKGVTQATVLEALRVGYRHLDCACDYGNEEEVGAGIAEAIKEGVCTREDIFVTSKLWNTFHAKENVKPACARTLKDLGLDYVDLYLIHFPISLKYVPFETRYPPEWTYEGKGSPAEGCVYEDVTIRETWEAMEELVAAGMAKNIGISNFAAPLIMDLLKYAKVKPAVLQIEHHPYLTQPTLIQYVQSLGIVITAYSSFGPASFSSIGMDQGAASLFTDKDVVAIAAAHSKSAGQVLLQWATQRGIVVIPKTANKERLIENLAVNDFLLTEEELNTLNGKDRNLRFNDPALYANYPIFA
jgi:diketogulonate reductase-like aldo/keto reductase